MRQDPVQLDYTSVTVGQPLGSRVRLEQHGAGALTFTVPPEVTAGGVLGAVALGALIAVLLIVFVAGLVEVRGAPAAAALASALLVPLGLCGMLLVATVRQMTRATVLSVGGGELSLRHAATFFGRSRRWRTSEIAKLKVPFRGISWRGRARGDLQVKLHGSLPVNVLTGRDRAELEWMAEELTRAIEHSLALTPVPVATILGPPTAVTQDPPTI